MRARDDELFEAVPALAGLPQNSGDHSFQKIPFKKRNNKSRFLQGSPTKKRGTLILTSPMKDLENICWTLWVPCCVGEGMTGAGKRGASDYWWSSRRWPVQKESPEVNI